MNYLVCEWEDKKCQLFQHVISINSEVILELGD